jgi:Tfp pilus assembly protein PilO
MKLRILFFPLMIVTILYLLIWVIYPKYDTIKTTKNKLKAVNEKLVSVRAKEQNAASLVQNLNKNSEEQSIITKYLPEKKQDEYVLASINSLAITSGVAIASMGFSENEMTQSVETLYDDLGNELPQDADKLKGIDVDIAVVGSYEKIRQFLFALSTINRLNEFSSITMTNGTAENPSELQVKISLKFSYLDRIKAISVVNDNFFASPEFDMNIVSDIRKKATIEIPKIDVGSVGRNNLFAL